MENIKTFNLILRKWEESDAGSLYYYAKDEAVGPIAGWPPHKSEEESLEIIRTVLNKEECYAVCLGFNNVAVGSISLMTGEDTDMTDKDDECELGFWIGKDFWGRGYIPEAAKALLERAFTELNMNKVWCGYYDGNEKSERVQEKLGFVYHHSCDEVRVPLMNEVRKGHTTLMTKEHWEELKRVP